MSLDLHPEELFDKAARGTLSSAEQAVLDAHLAQCSLCRFERQAVEDFAALPLPQLDVDALVTNALTARVTRPAHRPTRRRMPVLVAALVATFAMGSLAAVSTGVIPKLVAAVSGAHDVAPTPVVPHSAAPRPAPVVTPVAALPPVVETPPPRPPPPAPVRVVTPVVPAPVAEVVPTPDVPPPPAESSASLFESANRSRIQGDRTSAMAAYRRLLERFPMADEAAQTRATLGRLLLDQGDPAAALAQFDRYLGGEDRTLREDVMSARAVAFMRLGRDVEELSAWRALVEEFPQSVHASRARARIGALADP